MFFDVSRKVDILTCEIEWKIYDLKKHQKFMPHGQFLTSKQFYNPKCPSVVWEMRVYPNCEEMCSYPHNIKYNRNNYFYIDVSLIQKRMSGSYDTLKVRYNIYALDANWKRLNITSNGVWNFKNQTETLKDTISIQRIIHPDGSILLYCDIEFIPYNIKCEENIFDDFSNNISQKHFSNMYKQGINTDCVIKIGNEKINAHRCVLANNSIVFQRMFEQENMTEVKNGEINIIDSSPECFRLMLDYFYNCEINKNKLKRLVYDLFAVAHKYEVKSLMDKCEYMIASRNDKTNFTKNVNYIYLYDLPILEEACIKYIAENRKTFFKTNEWKNLKENYKDKANYLLESVLELEF